MAASKLSNLPERACTHVMTIKEDGIFDPVIYNLQITFSKILLTK